MTSLGPTPVLPPSHGPTTDQLLSDLLAQSGLPQGGLRCIQVFHLNHIGDMVFSLPVLASLRAAFPDAHIVSVVRPSVLDLGRMAGQSSEFLLREKHHGWKRRRLLAAELRSRRPDLSILLSQSYESTLLAWLSGSPRRVGFLDTGLGFLLTERVEKIGPPSVGNNLRLLGAAGIEPQKKDYIGLLRPPGEEAARMRQRLAEAGVQPESRLIVLGPGASLHGGVKEWTPEGFAAVADHFMAQPDTAVVVTGTTPADGIVGLAKRPVVDLSCRTSISELVALLARADLFIGIDAGTLHIAGAAGARIVGLYGPSDHTFTGPQALHCRVVTSAVPCSPCFKSRCALGRVCMMGITPQQVIQAAEETLAEV